MLNEIRHLSKVVAFPRTIGWRQGGRKRGVCRLGEGPPVHMERMLALGSESRDNLVRILDSMGRLSYNRLGEGPLGREATFWQSAGPSHPLARRA